MTSRRARWIVAGLAAFAVFGIAVAVGSAWLLWRALSAPPVVVVPEPAEYTEFKVTVTDQSLLIRNTGRDTFFTGLIKYRITRTDGAGVLFDSDEAFVDWPPGHDVVIFLPDHGMPGQVVVKIARTVQKEPGGPEYRLRYGPATLRTHRLTVEEVGFDPDLAAATDANRADIEPPPIQKK